MDLSGYQMEPLRAEEEFGLFRARRSDQSEPILAILSTTPTPSANLAERIEREFALRDALDPHWALRPLAMVQHNDQAALIFDDPGGQPLESSIHRPLELKRFLSIAVGLASALRGVHAAGLLHRDLRPGNIFIDRSGRILLFGFGFASRFSRERQVHGPTEIVPGTLAYMAPEQSGRVNRSIDHRSDLYSLGISLYELLVGDLPFKATHPLEWVHCHVARLPPPPSTRISGVPEVLDRIIMKLLAKNAEDRYQTAAGVEHDLRRCLADSSTAAPFEPGERDVPSRLFIPERLYGRDAETKALTDAFKNVAEHGSSDYLLISGEPGIGKSSLAQDLRSEVYAAGGLFAAGKFDQYKRDIPYATLTEAFHTLFRQILSQSPRELDVWRDALTAALGSNGRIIVDLFPEASLIIGEQPQLANVSPQESKNRFHLVFHRFISVFAQPEHPLVLFLDDIQWLDGATLELLELLATDAQIPNLLIIAAYRSSDVDEAHPLCTSLRRIREARGDLQELRLQPLRIADLSDLIGDTLHIDASGAQELAELVFEKTVGSPFFAIQFLMSLEAEKLLSFDATRATWRWDRDAIGRRAITENVAALISGKLQRYPPATIAVVKQLACIGRGATVSLLAEILDSAQSTVSDVLLMLIDAGLVSHVGDEFTFTHDRVREAAYALVGDAERPEMHLRIGRIFHRTLLANRRDSSLFDVVNHLNRGSVLVTDAAERRDLAELNLRAGVRAKAAAAYESAITYLDSGSAMLSAASWEAEYRLKFDLALHRADCEFMAGDMTAADRQFASLAESARGAADLTLVVGRQIGFYVYTRCVDRAIELSVGCLAKLGVVLPIAPTPEQVAEEYRTLMARIGARPVESLATLPRMTDPHWLTVMEALAQLFAPAGEANADLHHLAALRMANLTIEHGNADETPHAYACMAGLVLGWRLGTFSQAQAFGRLAMELVDDQGFNRYGSRVYAVISGTIGPWSRPLSECYKVAVRATELGREQGATTYSGYAWGCALTALLDSGRNLAEVDRQAGNSLSILANMKFALVMEFLTAQLMLVRALRGMTHSLSSMSDGNFDEDAFAETLSAQPGRWHALVRYRIRRLQLDVLAGERSHIAERLAWLDDQVAPLKVFEIAEYQFYGSLARVAEMRDGVADSPRQWELLRTSQEKLSAWEQLCPENFADRARLVEAEIASLERRELDAERLYEAAIALSRQYGFCQNEALGNELAAQFHARRGLDTIAQAYLRNARLCYARWGATAKVEQLESLHSALKDARPPEVRPSGGTGTHVKDLDVVAALDMYQALSQEILLDRLVQRLMATVVEHAGAVRGLLLLYHDDRLRIVAEAATDHDAVKVIPRPPAHFAGELPQSVLNYVIRTHEVVIIDDALEPNAHSGDAYILRARPRSVLCVPLVKQARVVGILYLENDLSAYAFTKEHVAVLQFVAAQAAVAIENAELFQSVQRTREEIRQAGSELRLSFDMIPALAWSATPDGTFEFSNKQWHDYTGLSEEEARGGTWMRAFHRDDLEKIAEKWRQLQRHRSSGEFEARMRRFDGQYRRFLVRLTPMRDPRGEVVKWHGTNTDIDDLKRAEEAQEALARASRITAMGELTVSIAHEVNQPLMAIVTNAATCVRWLAGDTPNVPEARRAAERIVRDGHRAGEVIASIRAMAGKSAREPAPLRLDEVITEVVQLTRNELDGNAITVETRFSEDAIHIIADRVQMQQLILNLVMNAIEAIAAASSTLRLLQIATSSGEAGFVEVSVADTGIGLQPENADRIFDAFYTTKPQGVGIGLSICRTIIESHGGRFSVEANVPRGTRLIFTLPRCRRETR